MATDNFTPQRSGYVGKRTCFAVHDQNFGGDLNMSVRNEIKAQIVRAGFTMQEVVDRLVEEYDWSDSVSNLSAKLQREMVIYSLELVRLRVH